MITLTKSHTRTHTTHTQISKWKHSNLTRDRQTDIHDPGGI